MHQLDDQTTREMLGFADRIAEENGFSLDYSDESLRTLDRMLNAFHGEYKEELEHDEEGWSGICISLGYYIGEVINKRVKRKLHWWYGPGEAAPDSAPTPYLKGLQVEIYPVDWIAKHIENGKKESVFRKVKFYVKDLDRRQEQALS